MVRLSLIGVCMATLIWLVAIVLGSGARVLAYGSLPEGERFVEIISQSYSLDRIYMSMQGPRGNQSRILLDDEIRGDDDVLWITGIDTVNVDSKTQERVSDEFFCHSNLTFCPQSITPVKHNASFPTKKHMDWRLFTLVPGRMRMELPAGFGIPIKASTELDYYTMALNQNPGPKRKTRMKTRILFRRDRDSDRKIQPLFRRALYVYQQHERDPAQGERVVPDKQSIHKGEECAETCDLDLTGDTPSSFASASTSAALDTHPGANCCVVNATKSGIIEQFGPKNTVHWMVPPGVHEYRTDVTAQLNLPADTTAHYVTGHLHPFGKSLKLVDLERGETVFRITSEDYSDRKGVKQMSEITSPKGIALRRGGRYQLIATYDNTTAKAIDAMGIMYVYALDDADPNLPLN